MRELKKKDIVNFLIGAAVLLVINIVLFLLNKNNGILYIIDLLYYMLTPAILLDLNEKYDSFYHRGGMY